MIPSQYYSFSGIVVTLYFFFLASCVLQILASPTPHYCRNDQRDALLEFKQEFPGRNMNSSSYNDMSSWNKKSDCCYWGAVVCDAKSGQVISLDLSKVALNNSLKPNSGLFKLLYLQRLYLLNCNLYGEIPSSFGNLSHLMELDLSINNLDGQVPSSIANLTQLRYLRLLENNLSGKFSVSLANLTNLVQLEIGNNYFEPELLPDMSRFHNLAIFWGGNFFGPFPTSLFTIPSLQWVDLGENNFTGPISFGNMSLSSSRLMFLSLEDNKLDGPIPKSMSKFLNLEQLDLRNNSFSGPFPTFLLTIPSLTIVNLAQNHFKGPIDFEKTSSSSSLGVLNIADNKFDGQIPESISKFHKLGELDVSNNKLEGNVPGCLLSLASLKLSHNSFTSVGKSSSQVSEQAEMRELRLDSNSFRGPFPYWICEMRSLEFLDMSNNSFSGSIPPCFRDITKFLEVLNLRNNNFSGNLPDVFVSATKLILLDVSRNRLVGKLPKSLINCIAMEFLNVEGNKFKDKFPSWLSSLLSLKVLILRSNQFYHPHVSVGFQRLKVIDVSHNDLTGTFPDFYFSDWFGMCQTTTLLNLENDVIYMEYLIDMNNYEAFVMNSRTYSSSMEMVYKGVDTKFEKIRKDFRAIDFSRNRFYGNIPESIGLLKGLRFLNLSSNAFTSNIPHSLANLTNLEALDVSHNQLSGQIPQDLGELSFLSTMNFAHNNLEGPIPRGTQFQRQNCSSFMDNPKLYGLDDDICRKTHVPNPAPQKSEEEQMISWIALAIAYGPGVFCGLVIGHIFISHKHEWFMERFRRNNPRVVIRSAR
ncbi:PREDICTED: receptor like protein 30-like [Camelina sativa]|uniref:Receptor like protein 30-like n=1 Tax=Camelina sativa TaxID=90675 RepID=A0ABM0TPL8_CAMSA|nr:PREDICTED: receptor like protein 30-like [Camelina sativa]